LEENDWFFVHIRQNEDKYRQNLGEILNLCLVVVDSRSVVMILGDIDDQPQHCAKNLESVFNSPFAMYLMELSTLASAHKQKKNKEMSSTFKISFFVSWEMKGTKPFSRK
jgi:hypothetical protein